MFPSVTESIRQAMSTCRSGWQGHGRSIWMSWYATRLTMGSGFVKTAELQRMLLTTVKCALVDRYNANNAVFIPIRNLPSTMCKNEIVTSLTDSISINWDSLFMQDMMEISVLLLHFTLVYGNTTTTTNTTTIHSCQATNLVLVIFRL